MKNPPSHAWLKMAKAQCVERCIIRGSKSCSLSVTHGLGGAAAGTA